MSFDWVLAWIRVQGALVILSLALSCLVRGSGYWSSLWSARRVSRVAKLLSASVLGVALFLPGSGFIPPGTGIRPALEIWSSARGQARAPSRLDLGASKSAVLSASFTGEHSLPLDRFVEALGLVILAAFFVGGLQLLRRLARLRSALQRSHLLRTVGRVRVAVSDGAAAPYSFRGLSYAWVVLPASYVEEPARFRIALLHELQHHRQGDTFWAMGSELASVTLGVAINPFVRYVERQMALLQEFACDESLVQRRRVSPHVYGRCLLEAAELSLRRPAVALAGTTGLATGASGSTLKRRIQMMFKTTRNSQGLAAPLVLALFGLGVLGSVAWSSQALVRDRRVTFDEARAWAEAANFSVGFPIVLNEAVLAQLNRFVGTPDGRKYMRESLARMEEYRPLVEAKIREYGFPPELAAIPIIESGYRNYKAKTAAGLWMFIPSTARNFGMRVDDVTDDRLVPPMETDAAMRLMGANYLRFKDWGLSLLAYNAGEGKVQRGIDETGSRDVWKLLASGHEGDRDYIPMYVAAAIILKNPRVLK